MFLDSVPSGFGGSRVTLRWTARAGVLLVMTNDEGCRMSAPVRLSLQGPAGLGGFCRTFRKQFQR